MTDNHLLSLFEIHTALMEMFANSLAPVPVDWKEELHVKLSIYSNRDCCYAFDSKKELNFVLPHLQRKPNYDTKGGEKLTLYLLPYQFRKFVKEVFKPDDIDFYFLKQE